MFSNRKRLRQIPCPVVFIASVDLYVIENAHDLYTCLQLQISVQSSSVRSSVVHCRLSTTSEFDVVQALGAREQFWLDALAVVTSD